MIIITIAIAIIICTIVITTIDIAITTHQLFRDGETIKTISIPIINDFQYEADVDFYVTLKNPIGSGAIAVGEPSIARVLIIDDDG